MSPGQLAWLAGRLTDTDLVCVYGAAAIHFPAIDVRDVAEAHILAMVTPEVSQHSSH